MASSHDKLDDILLSELECPVCLEYMLLPITLCENGHNICETCRPQLETCPTCGGVMTNTRCVTVEKMVEHLQYPCKYNILGCQQTFPVYLIAEHHVLCQFNTYKCPVEECEWKGTSSQLCTHVQDTHKEEVQVYDSENLVVFSDYDMGNDYKIIISNEQVFVASISVKNNVWNFVLQCVSSKEIASTYEYTLTFSNSDKGCIKVTHFTQSVKENLEDVYESSKCVKLPVDIVREFLIENDLFCLLEIKKL